jgi:hypothetical protein
MLHESLTAVIFQLNRVCMGNVKHVLGCCVKFVPDEDECSGACSYFAACASAHENVAFRVALKGG